MDNVETPITEEVKVEPVEHVEPELPEQVYRFQPTDSLGRPMGGEQVLKYKTQDELVKKLTEQNILVNRQLREVTKKNRLGITDKENLPEDVQKFNNRLQFTPRELSADERIQLSRDLLDPEKFEDATNTLFEATVGSKPSEFRAELSEMSANQMKIFAKIESDAFMATTPEYYPCQENFEAITNWMLRYELAPSRENFKLAFNTLRGDNIMVEKPTAPIQVESVVPEQVKVEEPIITPAPPKTVPLPTGLTRSQASNLPVVEKKEIYTLDQINKLSGEDYKKKLLHEKGFAELVDRLEQEALQAKRNKRN